MLSFPAGVQVYLCTQPIDLRKSFDGPCAVVELVFARSVFEGHLFLFLNQRRDRLKALWWDRDGLAIFYKRLERGRFELPRAADESSHVTLDATALAMRAAAWRSRRRVGLVTLDRLPCVTPLRPRRLRPLRRTRKRSLVAFAWRVRSSKKTRKNSSSR